MCEANPLPKQQGQPKEAKITLHLRSEILTDAEIDALVDRIEKRFRDRWPRSFGGSV